MIAAVLAVASVCIAAVLLYARRRLLIVTVTGTSMEPAYRHGDRLLARRSRLRHVKVGEVVILSPPPTGSSSLQMLKRVAAVSGDPVPPELAGRHDTTQGVVPHGYLAVLGDNARESADS
ncbi:S26 family signal peptidase [Nonomuraea insulae]|uniref:S26 family signal peptidase n=1 Tax=Nonomuraea insulae TaxID=1616787 RepID=A0ABW1CYG0_9ACTN